MPIPPVRRSPTSRRALAGALLALATPALACDDGRAVRRLHARATDARDGATDAPARERPTAPAQEPGGAIARRATLTVGPRFGDLVLRESSGLVAGAADGALLWTMADGGGPPDLLALSPDGRLVGRVRVSGAKNRDWEALAMGPCRAGVPGGPRTCVWIGDVGDNGADDAEGRARKNGREKVRLVRVPEPTRDAAGRLPAGVAAEVLTFRYEDGPRDVEAMAVLPTGDAWLFTKRHRRAPDKRRRPVLVYRVTAEAWGAAGEEDAPRAVATVVDSLPFVAGGGSFEGVTDAALDAARRVLAVRTYTTLYLVPLAVEGARWRVDHARRAVRCDLTPLREPQGEGLAFVGPQPAGAARLRTTSESNALGVGGLDTVECPLPP